MKKMLPCLLSLSFLCTGVAHAGSSPPPSEALTAWLTGLAFRSAKNAGANDQKGAGRGDVPLVITSIEDLDAPPEVKEHLRAQIAKSSGAAVSNATDPVPTVAALLSQLSGNVLPDKVLRQRLSLPPADVSATPLAKAKLLDTAWAGTRSGINATGLSRSFLLAGAGFIELSEEDYRQRNGQIIQFEEALNARVNSFPAEASSRRGADGGGMATLIWATDAKFFSLTLVTDQGESIVQGAALLKRIAEGIEG